MAEPSFDVGWIAPTDKSAEQANMNARSILIFALRQTVEGWNMTQEMAARRLGISRPRTSELLSGKIDKFSLDALFILAARAGLAVEINPSPRSLT
jgi:predicted XRE-type DNA-binding protein